jgi:hypothetical protein
VLPVPISKASSKTKLIRKGPLCRIRNGVLALIIKACKAVRLNIEEDFFVSTADGLRISLLDDRWELIRRTLMQQSNIMISKRVSRKGVAGISLMDVTTLRTWYDTLPKSQHALARNLTAGAIIINDKRKQWAETDACHRCGEKDS